MNSWDTKPFWIPLVIFAAIATVVAGLIPPPIDYKQLTMPRPKFVFFDQRVEDCQQLSHRRHQCQLFRFALS